MPTKTESSNIKPKKTGGNGGWPKYDWNGLKLKFFVSKSESVRGFLEDEQGIKENWNTRKFTNGWTEERIEFRAQAMEDAKEALKKQVADQIYTPSLKELWEMHKALLDICKMSILYIQQTYTKKNKDWKIEVVGMPDSNDVKRFWDIVKTEKWDPTQITKETDELAAHEDDYGE